MDDNFENLKLVTYPYPKYGETVLAIKLDKGNLQIADLSKVFTENNSLAEYEKTREQAEGLGKRIVLCVNSYDDLQQQVRELEAAKAELQAEVRRLKDKLGEK